jgi:hypothetical protein
MGEIGYLMREREREGERERERERTHSIRGVPASSGTQFTVLTMGLLLTCSD